jgi:hypothetical protein
VKRPQSALATDSAALGVGAALAVALAYGFVVVGSRSLGSSDFAPVALLWTYWLIANAVIAAPLQQWLIRSFIAGANATSLKRTLARTATVIVATALSLTLLLEAIRTTAFDSNSLVYPIVVGLITVGSLLIGAARGFQAARDRYRWVGASLAGESAIRMAGAGVGALFGWGPEYFAWLMPLGFLVAVMPPSALFGPSPTIATKQAGDTDVRLLMTTAGATLLPQLVWSFGPFAASVMGAAAATITGIFLLMALARVPYVIANAIGLRVLAWMTRAAMATGRDGLAPVRHSIIVAAVVLAPVAFVAAAALAPTVVHALFGEDVDVTRVEAALVGGGGVLGLAVLFLTFSLVAEAAAHRAIAAGVVALGAGGLCLATQIGRPSTTVAFAFAAAFAVYLAGITVAVGTRR